MTYSDYIGEYPTNPQIILEGKKLYKNLKEVFAHKVSDSFWSRIYKCFVGVYPETGGNNQLFYKELSPEQITEFESIINNSDLFKNNFLFIKLSDQHHSLINLEAAKIRISAHSEVFVYDEKEKISEYLKNNTENWFSVNGNESAVTAYGLLSGYPAYAAKAFTDKNEEKNKYTYKSDLFDGYIGFNKNFDKKYNDYLRGLLDEESPI